MLKKIEFIITNDDGAERSIWLSGRNAWALSRLIQAGKQGCTPINQPAPRWAAYVHILRTEYGLKIKTITEEHGGPFSGTHGRYVLQSNVKRALQGEIA